MFRISVYSPEVVFGAMDATRTRNVCLPDGKTVKRSSRLILFKTKGQACVTCGIEGTVFVLETHSLTVTPHLNLYAVTETGDMVLMTKDHIQPKSKGGANTLSNYDTMCSPCNARKGNKVTG